MCDIRERGHAKENKLSESLTAVGAEVDEWKALVRCRVLIFSGC